MSRLRIALLVGGSLALVLVLAGAVLLASLLPPTTPAPPVRDAILSGLTVVHPGRGREADRTLVLRGGRIAELRERRPGDPDPECAGCFAVPGLIDMHVHTPPRVALGNPEYFALLHLAHGVTTVRDLGQADGGIPALAEATRSGTKIGPRFLRCGPVIDGDPPGWPLGVVPEDAHAARALVDRLAAEGVDCIKVYNEVSKEIYDALREAADPHGIPVLGHVPHAIGMRGVRDFESQHLTGLPYLDRPRPPHGFDVRPQDLIELRGQPLEAAIDVALERRIAFIPTAANWELRLVPADPRRFPPPDAMRLLPTFWADAWDFLVWHPRDEDEIAVQLEVVQSVLRVSGRLRERGVPVLAGTDTIMPFVIPGDGLHRELAALERAFGSAEAALEAATRWNGRFLATRARERAGRPRLGSIEVGAAADLLIVERDPTRDLSALRDWRILFSAGRRYERPELDEIVERWRAHFRSPAYAAVVDGLIAVVGGAFASSSGAGDATPAAPAPPP